MKTDRVKDIIKASIFLSTTAILIGLFVFSPMNAHFDGNRLQDFISGSGLAAPALLLISCALGPLLFIPGTVFVGIGAAIFGPLMGFACVWPGTLAGAALSFYAARKLGRDFVYSMIGEKLTKYDDFIEQNGFKAVLFLRLMFVPLAPLNYGCGLTKVRFRDFFWATALGEAVTIWVILFFIGEIKSVWIPGEGERSSLWGMAFSVLLMAALVYVARLLHKKYSPGRRTQR